MVLTSIIESLLFAADKPLTIKQLCEVTNGKSPEIKEALQDLEREYQTSGIQLTQVNNGYQFRTNPTNASWVKKLLAGRPARLTRSMLETLAIVAYRQPVTRPEIEEIRGVDSAGTLRVLLERNLLRIVGKREEVGRPLLYGTTKYFLTFFQLKDLKELPSLRDFTELSEEHAEEFETRFGTGAADEALSDLSESSEKPLPEQATDDEAAETRPEATAASPEPTPDPPAEAKDEQPETQPQHAIEVDTAPVEKRDPLQEQRDLEREEEAALAALENAVSRADSTLSSFKKSASLPREEPPPPPPPTAPSGT